ncbi:hypothetical protein [Leifsonia aquatica]|uniref:hypothetical protein n=1 Tax=Leifsonia aquatica TaxID=144185 RepID=UPI00380AB603
MTAATLSGNFTLEQLQSALASHKPSHQTLEGGWASSDDTASNIGVRNVAPPSSDPEILPAEQSYPRRLAARYYFFRKTKQYKDAFPGGTDQEQSVVDALDIMVSEIPGTASFMVLFSARSNSLGQVIRKLREAALEFDEEAKVELDGALLGFSPDLFLWMVVRSREQRELDGHTTIQAVMSMNGHDNSRRVTVLTDGVDFNRPAFLVAVAEIEQLGPVRVALRDTTLEARVTADIWSSGGFSVLKGETAYSNYPDGPETRLRSMQDYAYELLPKLIETYARDVSWDDGKRKREILDAAQGLINRYLQKYPDLRGDLGLTESGSDD